MTQQLGKDGGQATCEDRDGRGGLTIAFNQPRYKDPTAITKEYNDARWLCVVMAKTDDGLFEVGRFVVCPPQDDGRQSRVVAMANCPGASDWTVLVSLADGEGDNASISLAVGECCSQGAPGVVRVAERYRQRASAASATVSLLAGQVVLGWTAFTNAAGATVEIGDLSPIPLPDGGSMSGAGGGLLEGPIDFDFVGAGIAGFLIELAESA